MFPFQGLCYLFCQKLAFVRLKNILSLENAYFKLVHILIEFLTTYSSRLFVKLSKIKNTEQNKTKHPVA